MMTARASQTPSHYQMASANRPDRTSEGGYRIHIIPVFFMTIPTATYMASIFCPGTGRGWSGRELAPTTSWGAAATASCSTERPKVTCRPGGGRFSQSVRPTSRTVPPRCFCAAPTVCVLHYGLRKRARQHCTRERGHRRFLAVRLLASSAPCGGVSQGKWPPSFEKWCQAVVCLPWRSSAMPATTLPERATATRPAPAGKESCRLPPHQRRTIAILAGGRQPVPVAGIAQQGNFVVAAAALAFRP